MSDSRDTYSQGQQSSSNDLSTIDCEGLTPGDGEFEMYNPAANLVQTLETEILPRLMLVHKLPGSETKKKTDNRPKIGPQEVKALVDILLEQSVMAGHELIEGMLDKGVALEHIYMHLLAPSARQMGELWDNDERDFSDVTIGLCRLQEILRNYQLEPAQDAVVPGVGCHSVLLTTSCGDQHVFGVVMVAEFFRKEGWLVTSEPGAPISELKRIIKKQHYDIIGLSIARTLTPEEIASEINVLRAASKNKDIKIMIGGALVDRKSTIVDDVGADGCSTDASEAPQAALQLLAKTSASC